MKPQRPRFRCQHRNVWVRMYSFIIGLQKLVICTLPGCMLKSLYYIIKHIAFLIQQSKHETNHCLLHLSTLFASHVLFLLAHGDDVTLTSKSELFSAERSWKKPLTCDSRSASFQSNPPISEQSAKESAIVANCISKTVYSIMHALSVT